MSKSNAKLVPQEGNVFIATYGSLRLGMENFRVNARGEGVHVGTGKTVDKFNLYAYASSYFPSVSLVHNDNDKQVVVDVFEAPISGMEGAYDALEGFYEKDSPQNFYNRSIIEIELDNGDRLDAWIYHIDEEQPTLVESGDWVEYKRK